MDSFRVNLYFVVPVTISLVMVAMYYSGIDILQQIIFPKMEGIYANSAREFGLVENLQNVVLLSILIMLALGLRRKTHRVEQAALVGVGCCALFVFLEEIDYGLHVWEYLRGIKADEAVEVRNFHNQGDRTSRMKQSADLGMVIFFIILPFALRNSDNRLVRHVLPDRYSALTLVGAFIVRSTAHYLQDHGYGEGGAISKNISEFREFMTYWLIMLYCKDIALSRHWGQTTLNPAPR